MIKKGLAVAVILLFIGVAVAPNINIYVVRASNDKYLVEVTTQACGIKGYDDTTVKLTREQYQDLEQYLADFRARLNQTTNREEAVPIFKETVVELNKYGLLPKGMSVEQAQNLVLSGTHKDMQSNSLKETNLKASNSLGVNQTRNLLCLIAGESTNTFFQTLINTILIKSIYLFIGSPLNVIYAFCSLVTFLAMYYFSQQMPLLSRILQIDSDLLQLMQDFFISLTTYSGLSAFDIIRYCPYVINGQYQSKGWIHTIGLMGNQTINGTLIGRIPAWPIGFFQFLGNPGVIGFTGIRLNINQTSHKSSYFGSALMVAVDLTTQ